MISYRDDGPRRIICLTEETTETLYLLGQQDRIIGVSGYTCRPKEARLKPRVSAFLSAKIEKIVDLQPDLVIGFSDLQAPIAQDLIRAGVNVLVFNQRSIPEILEMILTLARLVAAEAAGLQLVRQFSNDLGRIAASASVFPIRPRVFFEEWFDPIISGIRWVDELIEVAGGEPAFPGLRQQHAAKERIVSPADVANAAPDVIIASWCGRRVNKEQIRHREYGSIVPAVGRGHIYEVKSTYILQPGPAALTEGVRQLHAILAHVAGVNPAPNLEPAEAMDPDFLRRRAGA